VTYKPGDPAPTGYVAWDDWATVQHKAGLRQSQCHTCAKFYFPQEMKAHDCVMKGGDMMDDALRQTGRTTRMLEEAKALSTQGRAVYVVAANQHHAKQLACSLGKEWNGQIKIETEGSLGNLDWETLTLRGAHPNCVVLIDHYAIESRFARVLEMLHRYDAKEML